MTRSFLITLIGVEQNQIAFIKVRRGRNDVYLINCNCTAFLLGCILFFQFVV